MRDTLCSHTPPPPAPRFIFRVPKVKNLPQTKPSRWHFCVCHCFDCALCELAGWWQWIMLKHNRQPLLRKQNSVASLHQDRSNWMIQLYLMKGRGRFTCHLLETECARRQSQKSTQNCSGPPLGGCLSLGTWAVLWEQPGAARRSIWGFSHDKLLLIFLKLLLLSSSSSSFSSSLLKSILL